MAVTQNTYTGNGSTTDFAFTFTYLDPSHVKATINGTPTTAFTFFTSTVLRFNVAPANGAAIRIYRETPSSNLLANYSPGSGLRESDLELNLQQVLNVTQETQTFAENQSTTGLQAQITTANNNASNAVVTANAATATANAADATANGIAATANTALSNSNAAVATANSASSAATNAQTTANAALPKAGGTMTGDLVVPSINDGPLAGTRNRIINGDMRIDQRNNGAAASVASGYQYPVDRFRSFVNTATARWQSQRSTDAPTGFTNSFQVTVTTTQSSFAAGDLGVPLEQAIEGFNTADLNWGTVNAASVTLSFWVKASVTGNYAAAFFNYNGSAIDRSYVTSYAVNVANTWEYKIITVPGDTTGTWQAGNLQGIFVALAAAGGSNNLGTANTWQAGLREYPSGTVNIFATNGATIRFTGVQLEAGTVATPFERRSYGLELALCQRYARWAPLTIVGYQLAGGSITNQLILSPEMRAAPTAGANVQDPDLPTAGTTNVTDAGINNITRGSCTAFMLVTATGSAQTFYYRSFLSAEL